MNTNCPTYCQTLILTLNSVFQQVKSKLENAQSNKWNIEKKLQKVKILKLWIL